METTDRKCVLLVDDSRSVRKLLKFMLGMHMTLEICEAGDGLEAVHKLMENSFDLVITDIKMPQMDGLSLIKRVRREISLELPIIVVSSRGCSWATRKRPFLTASAFIFI